LSSYELSVLALLVGVSTSPLLSRALREAWAEPSRRALPLGLMALLLSDVSEVGGHDESMALLLGRGTLFRCGILQRVADGHARCEQDVFGSESALDWLCGANLSHRDYLGVLGEEPPERHRRALGPALRQLTANKAPIRATICGPEGSGRLAVAMQLAHMLAPDAGVFRLALDRAQRRGAIEEALATARTFAVLTGALVVVSGADVLADVRQATQEAVVDAFRELPVSVVWIVDSLSSEAMKAMAVHPEHVLRLTAPTRAERADTWRAALGDLLDGDAISRLSGGFLLTEGQIVQASREACASQPTSVSEPSDRFEERVAALARGVANTGMGALAQPEPCKFGLERLVLEPETRTLLDELVAYAKHRNALASRWGFDGALSYGTGVTALFTGPPGTGKTLAATAIARELGQELYRVDLSQMVSKYIGETEKHLGALFDAAEQGDVVLLFDEADSVFGKRTEVKTSVDRYANLEVNYLLQRIERFDGVVVLTTNFEAGIDEAFARRIRFRVAFDAPDAEARCALWRALMPGDVPLALDVDLPALAAQFELSGGHIKEVVLRAASLAMASSESVSQKHLERSAAAEYRKLGKLLPANMNRANPERTR